MSANKVNNQRINSFISLEDSYASCSETEEGTEYSTYGMLFDLEQQMPLLEFIVSKYFIDPNQPHSLIEKLNKYVVTQSGTPRIMGLQTTDGTKYFAKYISKEDCEREERSHKRLDPLNCPSIIRMIDVVYLGDCGLFITPLYESYEHRVLYTFPVDVMKMVLQALKVCHNNGIAHCDIKPCNVVWQWVPNPEEIEQVAVYLTDFGSACTDFSEYETKTIKSIPGTLGYYSPEKLRGEIPPDPRVMDVFAAGCFFIELMSCEFSRACGHGTLEDIHEMLQFLDWRLKLVQEDLVDLLKKMVEFDYKKRITVAEALEHSFFKNWNPRKQGTYPDWTSYCRLPRKPNKYYSDLSTY